MMTTAPISSLRARPRQRGAVMVETVLVLPLILVVLSILLFMGWNMMRLHRAAVVDRYETWRAVAHAPGPSAWVYHTDYDAGDPNDPTDDYWTVRYYNTDQLNQTFHADTADILEHTDYRFGHVGDGDDRRDGHFPSGARSAFRDRAAAYSTDADDYAREMLEHFPHGLRIEFRAEFETFVPLWERMTGPFYHHHARLNGDWRYANGIQYDESAEEWKADNPIVSPNYVVRDVFLEEFDDRLEAAEDSTDTRNLAHHVRRLYLRRPGYVGPNVDAQYPIQAN